MNPPDTPFYTLNFPVWPWDNLSCGGMSQKNATEVVRARVEGSLEAVESGHFRGDRHA